MTDKTTKLIFFLMFEKNLPKEFIKLSLELKNYDIDLIPIDYRDCDTVIKNEPPILMVLTSRLVHQEKFRDLKKGFLNFGLKTRRTRLIHLNSFGEPKEYLSYKKSLFYYSIALPVTIKECAALSYALCEKVNIRSEQWPGGKKSSITFDLNPSRSRF